MCSLAGAAAAGHGAVRLAAAEPEVHPQAGLTHPRRDLRARVQLHQPGVGRFSQYLTVAATDYGHIFYQLPLAQKPYLQPAEVQVDSSVSDHGVSMEMLFSKCKGKDKVLPVRGADQDNAMEYLQSVINLFDDAGGSNMEKQNEEEVFQSMKIDEETQEIEANKRRQSFTVNIQDMLSSFDLFEDDDGESVTEHQNEEGKLERKNNGDERNVGIQQIENLDEILTSFENEESVPEPYEENSRWADVRTRGVTEYECPVSTSPIIIVYLSMYVINEYCPNL